jgi:hypothetical protein
MLSYALTTRQRLINFLGLQNLTTTHNTVLDLCIESATEFVENYTKRRFKKTARTAEVYDGHGGRSLNLKHYPVVPGETFNLYCRETNENESEWDEIDDEYYFVKNDPGIVELVVGKFTKGIQRWKVDYTSGYGFDNVTTFPSDVGLADLEYVVWKLAGTMYLKRRGEVGVTMETLHSHSVAYHKEVMESPEIKEILDKYASPFDNCVVYAGED